MSREKKIMASVAACFGSLLIALVASGTVTDKVLWFFEISVFCLVVIWTIL
ncbi:MAG: hypothetical protein KGJ19_09625 [Betaproteobacteria bacterium]|nr:hypothetical protein [Betaproteobacteria bacterium]